MAAMSNYLENKLIDLVLRGQAFTAPPTWVALFTTATTDAGGGTEVSLSGTAYGRVQVPNNMTSSGWCGTQAASSTSASSGTDATSSNNAPIPFATPTALWGTISHFAIYDAQTSGNPLIHGALTTPKLVSNGDSAPSFGVSQLSFQIDT